MLIRDIECVTGRHVVDQSGFKGTFDFPLGHPWMSGVVR